MQRPPRNEPSRPPAGTRPEQNQRLPRLTRKAAHAQDVRAEPASLLRDFIFEALAPVEADAAATLLCLANDDDAGARYFHLKRVAVGVKAAALTFRELDARVLPMSGDLGGVSRGFISFNWPLEERFFPPFLNAYFAREARDYDERSSERDTSRRPFRSRRRAASRGHIRSLR